MRLFVGIPLAAKVIEELSAISLRLQSSEDGLRWSTAESWHITLQFLGNTPEYECVVARLRDLRSTSVPIQLEGLDFFERAGVFFAGVRLTPELNVLQQRVTTATRLCGFIAETRPYHPHITLARSKGKGGKRGLNALKNKVHRQPKFSDFVAEEFFLYESVSTPTGSLYQIRERFPLVRVTKSGCPTSRSFFARCGIPLHLPSDSRFIRCTKRSTSVVSHISRKTSEMWGTRTSPGNKVRYLGIKRIS